MTHSPLESPLDFGNFAVLIPSPTDRSPNSLAGDYCHYICVYFIELCFQMQLYYEALLQPGVMLCQNIMS
jgi:hypothetical protein